MEAWAAQATINSLGTSFISGQNITLNGNWGANGDNTPMIWDDFEKGEQGPPLIPYLKGENGLSVRQVHQLSIQTFMRTQEGKVPTHLHTLLAQQT